MNKRLREIHLQSAARGNTQMHSFEKILTIAEVAQILRMHRNTVYRLVKRGDLPGFKIGDNWRVKEKALLTVLGRETDRSSTLTGGAASGTTPHETSPSRAKQLSIHSEVEGKSDRVP